MALLRDLPGFGALVDNLSAIIGGFDNKDLAFAIALTILLMAVVIGGFLHLWGHRRWVQPIRRLSAKLEKLYHSDLDADGRLNKADEAFESEAKCAPLWRDYRKHLQPNPQVPGYLNLVDPRLLFSVDSLPGHGYEQWCATWAGIFLTVGLLFTFIGLSAALLKVGGIDGADSAAMKAAITGILGVSSAKFITSIAGLIAYIGFSLLTSHYQSSQQAAARQLADAVQHLSVPLTPELILHEQNDIAHRQLTRMERLTDDLAVAIDAKLEQRLKVLAADFGQHLGTIQQDLPSATADPIVKAINNMSQAVAQEFSNQVQQTAGGEINTVAKRFTDLAEVLDGIKTGMDSMGKEFGTEIKGAADSLVKAANRMGEGVQTQSTKLEQKIDAFGKTLESIDSNLHGVPKHISNALDTTMHKLTEAIDGLAKRLAEGGESGATALTTGSEEAGNKLKASAGEAGEDLKERIGEVSGKLDSIAGALGQVPDNITQALNTTMTKLTEAIDGLAKRLAEGGESGATALTTGGEEAGNKLKASAGEAGEDLKERIGEVSGKLDSIAGALGQVPDNITQALNTTMHKLTTAITTLTERLAQGGQDGGDALRKGGQQAGEQIEKTVGRAGSEFDRLVTQASGELVKKFAAAQAGLQDAIKDLASRLQTVESSLKVLPDAVAAQVEHLQAAGQTFMAAGQTVTGASGALQQAAQPLQQTATVLRSSVDQLREGVEKAKEIHQKASASSESALNGLKQAAAAAERTFNSHVERFGRVDEELAKALATLRDGVEQVAKETQKIFKEYDEHITKAVNSLGSVAEDLKEAAEEIGASVKQLAEARQPPRRP